MRVDRCPSRQVRYLQGQNARLQEKLAHAERSASATLAQKVALLCTSQACILSVWSGGCLAVCLPTLLSLCLLRMESLLSPLERAAEHCWGILLCMRCGVFYQDGTCSSHCMVHKYQNAALS